MRGSHRIFRKLSLMKNSRNWLRAMQDEIDSLQKIETNELVQLLKGRKSLKTKWVFKWLRDTVEENASKLKKIYTNKNVSNMLIKIKIVHKQKLQLCIGTTGLNSMWWSFILAFFPQVLEGEIVRLSLSNPWKFLIY